MKKRIVVIFVLLMFLLAGCNNKEEEIDCSKSPTHESCDVVDEELPPVTEEKTCEEDPSQDKCEQEEIEEVILTCEESGLTDCAFSLAFANEDKTYTEIATYEVLSEAQTVMKDKSEDNVVVLNENNKVLGMKYGAVNFKTKSIYETTFLGHVDYKNPTYLNGNYNVDGVFLDCDNLLVFGMIAGVKFEVNAFEVELIPYNFSKNGYSYYEVIEEELVHKISYDIMSASFQSIGAIDIAPTYLDAEEKYYSYDNHYFYQDIKTMTDDLNNGVYTNAVNSETPYYNYYQYLSFRSTTNYTEEELNSYLNSKVSTSSGLYNTGSDFINAQDEVMINAAMELSFAIHESGWGSSAIAKYKNNLFGIDAYDSDPYNSAKTFDTVQDCIEYHAQYLLGSRYFNPNYYVSFGTNFGNKYQGMNYKYASDAFWGEKIAKHYYNLDKALGFKDRNSNTIVLLKPDAVGYYSPNLTSPVIYDSSLYNYYGLYIPFVVKKEKEEFYSLFLPVGLNDDLEMDIDEIMNINDVFYVLKDDVIVIN